MVLVVGFAFVGLPFGRKIWSAVVRCFPLTTLAEAPWAEVLMPLLVFHVRMPLLRVFHQQHLWQHLGQKLISFIKVISVHQKGSLKAIQ